MIALIATSLAWISVLSLAVVTFLGTAVSMGWIIGGTLCLGLVVAVIVIHKEVRRATELPDYFEPVELSLPMGNRQGESRHSLRPNAMSASRTVTTIAGTAAGHYHRILPRRIRARKNRPRTAKRN